VLLGSSSNFCCCFSVSVVEVDDDDDTVRFLLLLPCCRLAKGEDKEETNNRCWLLLVLTRLLVEKSHVVWIVVVIVRVWLYKWFLQTLSEVWSLCGAQICSNLLKIFSLLLHKNTKTQKLIDAHLQRMLGGDWGPRVHHSMWTSVLCVFLSLLYYCLRRSLKFFCFSSLVLSSFCRRRSLSLSLFFLRIFYY
jgi:hypothetical protein